MAKHGKNSVILKDGFNLSLYLQDIEFSRSISEAETTVFADGNNKTFIPGIGETTLSANGFFDGTVGAVDEILNATINNVVNIWTYYPNGDAKGNIGRAVSGIFTSYGINSTFDDAVKISIAGRGNTQLYKTISLKPLANITSTTTTTAVDNTTSSANGGKAIIQINNSTGTIPVKLEHSSDNLNWTTLVNFTNVTTDLTAEIVTFTGTVNRYVRAVLTLDGGEQINCQISLIRI